MALGDPYATLAELKARVDITDANDDAKLTDALSTASRDIEGYCRRQFNKQTGATARTYHRLHNALVLIDDLWTTASLVVAVDYDDDGVYETVWTSTEYVLEPVNGTVEGELGWPYWRLRAVGGLRFPVWRRPAVQVTAQWGWNAVPSPVHEACLVAGEEAFKLKDAPFGPSVRIENNRYVTGMLNKYRRNSVRLAGRDQFLVA